jgi:hypothetical protein
MPLDADQISCKVCSLRSKSKNLYNLSAQIYVLKQIKGHILVIFDWYVHLLRGFLHRLNDGDGFQFISLPQKSTFVQTI